MSIFEDLEAMSAPEAARFLLGYDMMRDLPNGTSARVRIVETEAYDETDAASHSYNGKTARTEVMFGDPGMVYVYFTYGMHHCMNIVVGPCGYGAAVLIRAVRVVEGDSVLGAYRNKQGVSRTNGPAKLCEALAIDKQMNGHDLRDKPLRLVRGESIEESMIVSGERIGISKAKNIPWRFHIKDDSYVSHSRTAGK